MNPFFSICMPVTDRGKTIFNALESVAKQSFKDFELIIIDCGSRDNSRDEIERFFDSQVFKSNIFPYKYEKREYRPKTIEDWNEPVRLAKGKYIAMLEGDDQFLPNNLNDAYKILTSTSNIGMYATGNQGNGRKHTGFLPKDEWLKMAIEMFDPAPPSEAIFIRLDKSGEPFLYDDINYEYAPETDLYVRIALNGFNAYHSDSRNVVRDVSIKNRTTWHYFVDRFTLLKMYKENYSYAFDSLYNHNLAIAIRGALKGNSVSNFLSFSRKMIRKTSFSDYVKALPLSIIDYLLKLKSV